MNFEHTVFAYLDAQFAAHKHVQGCGLCKLAGPHPTCDRAQRAQARLVEALGVLRTHARAIGWTPEDGATVNARGEVVSDEGRVLTAGR